MSAAGPDGPAEGGTRAHTNDWLVIRSHTDFAASPRAEIIAVPSPDGQPPYIVRWEDSGHEGVVFPGPDAQVVTGG